MTIRHLPPDPAPAPHGPTPHGPDTRAPDAGPATGTDPTTSTDPKDGTGSASGAVAGGATTDEAADRAAWLRMSAALSAQVPVLAEREDVTVTIAPGAGRGAPGCFVPALATIELDTATFTDAGLDPATARPDRPTDRDRYPAAWGVFTHECAHARHSRWHPSDDAPPPTAAAAAAALLEESRIEAAHLTRRPGDRRWLRAAATTLILPEFPATTSTTGGQEAEAPEQESPAHEGSSAPATAAPPAVTGAEPVTEPVPAPPAAPLTVPPSGDPAEAPSGTTGPGPVVERWAAARAAGLVLARHDAGVLDEDETATVAEAVTAALGRDRLRGLREVWQAAHTTADEDTEAMLSLARTWCHTLGVDPDGPAPDETTPGTGIWSPGGTGAGLVAAIGATLAAVTEHDTPPPTPPRPDRATARKAELAARAAADRAARTVFRPGPAGHSETGTTSLGPARPPTPDEQAAARCLARALKKAAARDRTATTTASPTPPGRLRMRAALAADAQRAAGTVPTAEPFTRTVRRHVLSPPLRVGIACDVSGSMWAVAPAVASAAWILARAVSHVTDAKAATVIYGNHVRPLTHPGQAPTHVQDFPAADGTERFTRAIDALDAAVDLTRPGAARLLVIVSDGCYTPSELDTGQHRITRLRATGCGILWIGLNHATRAMPGTRPLVLTDPATAPDAIADAVTATLRHA